jgi:putative peptidoglycan lipid II flippase
VIASVALVRTIGFQGLALGTSIAAIVNASLLLALLRRRLGGLEGRRLLTTLVKVTASSTVMAGAAVAMLRAMERSAPGPGLAAQAIRLGVTIGVSLAALAVMARVLGVEAFGDAVEMANSRVRKLLSK